jgi:hypothetical protein
LVDHPRSLQPVAISVTTIAWTNLPAAEVPGVGDKMDLEKHWWRIFPTAEPFAVARVVSAGRALSAAPPVTEIHNS